MLGPWGIALRIVYLLVLGVGSAFTAGAIWNSITDYEPPPPVQGNPESAPSLTDRLVLVVLDGIRLDVVGKLPFLKGVMDRGASWTIETVQPSLSNPARAVLATGAWPELNGVTNNGKYSPPPVDSIFSLARRAGIPTVAAGSSFWKRAFGDHIDQLVTSRAKKLHHGAPPAELIAWQEGLCTDYIEALRRHDTGLLVVGLFAADAAGHDFGGESTEYVEVARAVDACLAKIIAALDDGQTTFFVTSDHGHIQHRGHGGHGGQEPEVTHVPLTAWGRGVVRFPGGSAKQVDVAPTICALMGLPLPTTTQGRILIEALDAPEALRSQLISLDHSQRKLIADVLGRSGYPGAFRIIERPDRILPALGMLTFFCAVVFVIGLRRPRSFVLPVVGPAVYYVLYYAGFWAMGLGYSLSVVGREEFLWNFFGRNMAAAAGALFIAGYAISRRAAAWQAAKLFLDLGLLVTASLALQVVVLYFQDGLFMNRFMPPLDMSFKACLDLTQLFAASAAAAIGFAIQGVVEKRASTTPATEPRFPSHPSTH